MEAIDGLTYLLATSSRGDEYVVRYTRNEIDELFSDEEQKAMAIGGAVVREEDRPAIRMSERRESVRYVDMVAAARAVR
jgi:hypothetical protein